MPSTIHHDYTDDQIHVPGYVQTADPGAIGAGKVWVDTTGNASGYFILNIRNNADSGWLTLGSFPIALLTGLIAFSGVITPTTLAANTNDWAPTGLATASTIRVAASSAVNLTGITGGQNGRILILHNVGSFAITLTNNATSTAANRFQWVADLPLAAGAGIMLRYDSTSSRWRPILPSIVTTLNGLSGPVILAAGSNVTLTPVGNTITIASTGGGGGGSGTVTDVSVTTANGVSGSVATSTTTPAITLALGAITPTNVTASTFLKAGGLTGAVAASRYAGATASGAPVAGTFAVGDYVIAQDGAVFVCTVAGTPGTWVNTGAGGAGTVTSVSATATPTGIFDIVVTNPTTTPAIALSMDTQTASKVLAGPISGAAAVPAFRALDAADLNVTGSKFISSLATSGTGTSGSPWAGWETPLTTAIAAGVLDWTFNNRSDGTVGNYTTAGGVGIADAKDLRLRSHAGAIVIYTGGAGPIFQFTSAGVPNASTVSILDLPIIAGNGTATSCVDMTGCNHSIVRIRGYGATNLLALHAAVCSKFWLSGSANSDPSAVAHTILVDTLTTDCDFYVIAEGNPGVGMKLDSCVGCTFRGTSEGNTGGSGIGLTLGNVSDRNTFIDLDFEANAAGDVTVDSSFNTFLNCLSTTTVTVTGLYGNVFQGGQYEDMVFSTGGHTIRDLGFNSAGAGSITGAGLATCYVMNVRNIFGVAYLPDQLPNYTPPAPSTGDRVQIVNTVGQSIPDFVAGGSVWTPIVFNIENYDTNSMWSVGTPGSVIIQTTGEYDMEFWSQSATTLATGVWGVRVAVGGSGANQTIFPAGVVILSSGICSVQGYQLNATDVLTFELMQSSGLAVNAGVAVVTITQRA